MCRQSATVCLVKSLTRQHRAIGLLAGRLQALADPRCRRGKRHPFVAVRGFTLDREHRLLCGGGRRS